jgi:hypothetical protein
MIVIGDAAWKSITRQAARVNSSKVPGPVTRAFSRSS